MNKKIIDDLIKETLITKRMKSRFKIYQDFLNLPENDNITEFYKKIDVFGSCMENVEEIQAICLILETIILKSLEIYKKKQIQIFNKINLKDNPQIKAETTARLARHSGVFLKDMYEVSSFVDYYIKTVKEKE